MIGGETEVVKHLESDFQDARPGRGNVDRTPGRDKVPGTGRGRLPPLRPFRRRPFRQDGPQRHRVRLDGGHAEGLNILKHANAGNPIAKPTQKPLRSEIPKTISTISISRTSPKYGAAAASSPPGCST